MMSEQPEFKSFEEFWPFYLGEHRLIMCRTLHYIGTVMATSTLIFLIWQGMWAWLPIILPLGYGPAWIGHFFIEKNKPASFKYPLWSFIGDYKMFWMAMRGQIRGELSRLFGKQSKQGKK